MPLLITTGHYWSDSVLSLTFIVTLHCGVINTAPTGSLVQKYIKNVYAYKPGVQSHNSTIIHITLHDVCLFGITGKGFLRAYVTSRRWRAACMHECGPPSMHCDTRRSSATLWSVCQCSDCSSPANQQGHNRAYWEHCCV